MFKKIVSEDLFLTTDDEDGSSCVMQKVTPMQESTAANVPAKTSRAERHGTHTNDDVLYGARSPAKTPSKAAIKKAYNERLKEMAIPVNPKSNFF